MGDFDVGECVPDEDALHAGRCDDLQRLLLGHADPSITLRVYAHVIRQHAVGVAEVFARQVEEEDQAPDEADQLPRRDDLLLAEALASRPPDGNGCQ
ncbi:hypothetical protein [Actinopolymorpha cephalotaxi]|uniref:Phage integrase family protein n=1 Tax=Actinopolymorpha cephalotaxi TaxID=504797 RepID=A0ABX2SBN1_9ACTN|nr:hypothetical protein [Actinopolymorpha cephalotaxi]NYH87063.1 hypothetical protein [Actinopolymorpha cephalotaxi]